MICLMSDCTSFPGVSFLTMCKFQQHPFGCVVVVYTDKLSEKLEKKAKFGNMTVQFCPFVILVEDHLRVYAMEEEWTL